MDWSFDNFSGWEEAINEFSKSDWIDKHNSLSVGEFKQADNKVLAGWQGFVAGKEDWETDVGNWYKENIIKGLNDKTNEFVKDAQEFETAYSESKFIKGLEDTKKKVEKALEWASPLLDNKISKELQEKFLSTTANALVASATNWFGNYKYINGVYFNGKSAPSTKDKNGNQDDKNEKSAIDKAQEIPFEYTVSNIKNSELKELFLAGPDLFSNSFSAFLVADNGAGTQSILNFNNLNNNSFNMSKFTLDSFLSNPTEISTRAVSVSIPMRLQSSYSQKFFNKSAEIASHGISFSNKGTLSLDLDSNLDCANLIYNLSALNLYGNTIQRNDGEITLDKEKTKTTSAAFKGNKGKINLIVNSRSFTGFHNIYFNPNKQNTYNNIIYIFQNVKFLGLDSISFSRESTDILTKEFEFVFESLIEAYKLKSDLPNPTEVEKKPASAEKGQSINVFTSSLNMDAHYSSIEDIKFIRTI